MTNAERFIVPVRNFLQTLFILSALFTSQSVFAETYKLIYSHTSDRAGSIILQGATVSGNIYGRLNPETGNINRVRFYQDGATTPFQTESYAPYELRSGGATAIAYDTTLLSDGPHSIRTDVRRRVSFSNQTTSFTTNFVVDNSGSGPNDSSNISVAINNGNDDVEEKESTGTIYFNSSDLELIYDSYNNQNKQTVGLRFNGLNIPQGSLITNAYIEFTVDESDSQAINLNIAAQDIDNAPAFSSSNFNVSSRTKTSANITWSPAAWSSVSAKKQTADLSNIVQEVISRSGWAANNSMVFIISGNSNGQRVADSYNGSPYAAPRLVVEFDALSGPTNNAPTLAAIADQTVEEGTSLSINFTASDIDDDSLTFSTSPLPAFVTLTDNNNGSASLNFAPITGDAASYIIKQTVSDGELTAEQTFTLIITEPVVTNTAPVLTTINAQSLQVDGSLSVGLTATDIDGDSLIFSAPVKPSFVSLTDIANGTAVLQLAPVAADEGQHTVTISVTDGLLAVQQSFVITVTALPTTSNSITRIDLTAASIVDEPKRPGTFKLVSDGFSQDTGVLNMGIEFRGSTSQDFDKKSFSLELVKADNPDKELKLSLLDLRKDGDWILDASYRDTSFVRNLVGHDIFNDMHPHAFIDEDGDGQGQAAIRGGLSEVYLNGQYHGVYLLSEKVDRKLLGLKKISVPEDADGNELFDQIDFSDPDNGSVIYKASSNLASLDFINTARTDFEQKYPKLDDVARWEPLEELISLITNSTDAEFMSTIGELIDIDSVVDYWLLMNVIADTDSFNKNYYLARSGGGKFFMVPWDNDASFSMWWDGERIDWTFAYWAPEENALIRRLISLPQSGFNSKVKLRWAQLRSTLYTQQALSERFVTYHALLDAVDENGQSARDRNLSRWPNSGNLGAANPELGTAQFINNWLADRLLMLDELIDGMAE